MDKYVANELLYELILLNLSVLMGHWQNETASDSAIIDSRDNCPTLALQYQNLPSTIWVSDPQ